MFNKQRETIITETRITNAGSIKGMGKIVFVIPGAAICKITKDGKIETVKEEKNTEED